MKRVVLISPDCTTPFYESSRRTHLTGSVDLYTPTLLGVPVELLFRFRNFAVNTGDGLYRPVSRFVASQIHRNTLRGPVFRGYSHFQ